MHLQRIKSLLDKDRRGVKWLAEQVGMSNQNLYKCIENNRIEAADLYKIANILGVDLEYFFKDSIEESQLNENDYKKYEVIIQVKLTDKQKETDLLRMIFGNELLKAINK